MVLALGVGLESRGCRLGLFVNKSEVGNCIQSWEFAEGLMIEKGCFEVNPDSQAMKRLVSRTQA
jgi:hypothetical protein